MLSVAMIAILPNIRSFHNVGSILMRRHDLGRVALVVGNEIKGLPRSIRARADHILEIPMHGKKESLNVAVALGIVAFALRER